MRARLLAIAVIGAVGVVCMGCGAHGPPPVPVSIQRPAPAVISQTTYGEALRSYRMLDRNDPQRVPLRERLVQYRLTQAAEVLGGDDYEALVEELANITQLYTPEEIADHQLPQGLRPLAEKLVEKGSPRGDEARVLSAYLVLKLLRPNDAEAARNYDKLKRWGFEVRSALSGPVERFEGLIEVWEEHARLTPTPELLNKVARMLIERRDATLALFRSSEERPQLSPEAFDAVRRTVVSVAAVHLAHGDIASALTHVRALGDGGIEERLADLLELAREDGSDGAGALLDLARAYGEVGRPDVERALCLTGLRAHRNDARFPQCLARNAAAQSDYAGAMSWYAGAVQLAPDERALYDEILEVLNSLIEEGLFSADVTETRRLAARASEILSERVRRWPNSPPPIRPDELYLAIGIAEMNAGNASEAEARLRESLAARETTSALLQLGLLLERMGRGQEAADVYRRALQVVGAEGDRVAQPQRAEILERLGDTLRLLGDKTEASKHYAEGLALWDANLSMLKGRRVGLAHLRRGVLLGRLSRTADAIGAFEQAMELAPTVRETYATILASMVVSGADLAFAQRVFRNALNQLSLEPEWKVYFALWLRTIAASSGAQTDPDIDDMIEDLGRGKDWPATLARFAAGRVDYNGLLEAASDPGERTEAHFYEGVRRLAGGDIAGAHELFRKVLDTRMVNFYEFAMAQELDARIAQP